MEAPSQMQFENCRDAEAAWRNIFQMVAHDWAPYIVLLAGAPPDQGTVAGGRVPAIRRCTNPTDHQLLPLAAKIWSKTPPSLKWVSCALDQPPNTSSMVNKVTFENCALYFSAAFASRGR